MSKELTPLEEFRTIEALYRSLKIEAERLYAMCFTNEPGFEDLEDKFKVIETALNGLEDLKLAYQQQTDITIKLCKALDIIKVLFNGRAKLYERNDGIEQVVDKNGNYNKAGISVHILEFWVGDLHYEFHLHKEEYDLLKEVLL